MSAPPTTSSSTTSPRTSSPISSSPARTLITACLRSLDESSLRTLQHSRSHRADSIALSSAYERIRVAAANEQTAATHHQLITQHSRTSRVHTQLLHSAAMLTARGGSPPSPPHYDLQAFVDFCRLSAALQQSEEQHRASGEVLRVTPGLAVPVQAVLRSTVYVELRRKVDEMTQLMLAECAQGQQRKAQLDEALAALLASKDHNDRQRQSTPLQM